MAIHRMFAELSKSNADAEAAVPHEVNGKKGPISWALASFLREMPVAERSAGGREAAYFALPGQSRGARAGRGPRAGGKVVASMRNRAQPIAIFGAGRGCFDRYGSGR